MVNVLYDIILTVNNTIIMDMPNDCFDSNINLNGSETNESPSQHATNGLNEELENFLKKWRNELASNNDYGKEIENNDVLTNILSNVCDTNDNDVIDAMQYFNRGVLLEQRGKLYDAVTYYRKATQLVPDIEFKMYNLEQNLCQGNASSDTNDRIDDGNAQMKNNNYNESDDDDDDCDDLISKFFSSITDDDRNVCLCRPQIPQFAYHISSLPYEVILYILKWVVSNELDLRSLEQFSLVCRGFYIAARDPEIWKLSCYKLWGNSVSSLISHYNGCWRTMFIEKPHLYFNGAYISRTSYIRQGETSFQDYVYRPCHIVEYYRYFRFYPDGFVLMLTTPDDPYQSLPSLRNRKPKNSNVLRGYYTFSGTTVTAVFKKEYTNDSFNFRKHKNNLKRENVTLSQTFNITLELKSSKNRRNVQLSWIFYSIHVQRSNGQEFISTFDITPNGFPSFWFSRVKSYTGESESLLC